MMIIQEEPKAGSPVHSAARTALQLLLTLHCFRGHVTVQVLVLKQVSKCIQQKASGLYSYCALSNKLLCRIAAGGMPLMDIVLCLRSALCLYALQKLAWL
jgi:hypothetical protein